MIPINGFFEYGIMAILGAAGTVGFTIWTLASTQTSQSKKIIVKSQVEKSVSEPFQYKKAA